MKMREFGSPGVRVPGARPLDPPLRLEGLKLRLNKRLATSWHRSKISKIIHF